MRKALLVLTLVGASFAGGAVVNGPGLAWVRDMVGLTPPHLNLRGQADQPGSDLPQLDNPSHRAGDLNSDPTSTAPRSALSEPSGEHPTTRPTTKHRTFPANASSSTRSGNSFGQKEEPGPSLASAETQADVSSPPPLEAPTAGPAGAGSAPRNAAPAPPAELAASEPAHAAGGSMRDGSLHRSSAANVDDSGSGSGTTPPTPVTATTWADVASKLRAQGVTRFWIEGEPGQSVRVRCALPMPGHASIYQQFEAESSDPVAAAQAVLNRIVLWHATESP